MEKEIELLRKSQNEMALKISSLESKLDEKSAQLTELETKFKNLEADNKASKLNLKKIEKSTTDQAEAQKRSDIERTKCSVIIKGIPYHKEASNSNETRKQTFEVCRSLLSQLEVGQELGFPDVIRFKQNPEAKDPALVKMTLNNAKQKGRLYEALAKASKSKSKKVPKVSVTDELPAFLRQKQKTLEKQAYEIRQSFKDVKTRIFVKGTDIVLRRKLAGETTFSDLTEGEFDNDHPPSKIEATKVRNKPGPKPKTGQASEPERTSVRNSNAKK